MKTNKRSFVVSAGVLVLLAAWGSRSGTPGAAKSAPASVVSPEAVRPRAVQNYGKLPLSFEANRGQTDAQVRFLARGQGYTLFLTSQEAVLSLRKLEASRRNGAKSENRGLELTPGRFSLFNDDLRLAAERAKSQDAQRTTNAVLQMRLVGANANGKVNAVEELPAKSNYFIGNDPKKWHTNIPTYAKLRVENIYPGVDLVYYGNQGQLEYDFVVGPGADASAIKFALTFGPSAKGKDFSDSINATHEASMKIDSDGDLLLQADDGEVLFHKPVIYQPVSQSGRPISEKTLVAGGYTINEQKEVAFAISYYDRTKPLVIDPTLAYSTYLGGSHNDAGAGIVVDSFGSAYVTGQTNSTDFPTASPLQSTNHSLGDNAFISKFTPDGSALVYSTYLGGSDSDSESGIAVDSSVNAYVAGYTYSTDFPTTNAFQGTNHGSPDAFVAKLNPAGSALVYSTYLGGSGQDEGTGIAVDSSSNAYVTGVTGSTDFPTANPLQPTNHSHGGIPSFTNDAFVAKISTPTMCGASRLCYGGPIDHQPRPQFDAGRLPAYLHDRLGIDDGNGVSGIIELDCLYSCQTNCRVTCFCLGLYNGAYASWPTLATLNGTVTSGSPLGGDYVPVGLAGIGYISPGYQ